MAGCTSSVSSTSKRCSMAPLGYDVRVQSLSPVTATLEEDRPAFVKFGFLTRVGYMSSEHGAPDRLLFGG